MSVPPMQELVRVLFHCGLGADRTFCDITVCGAVPRGMALRRNGARAGHEIYVSGLLGGSALGLEARKGKAPRGKAWKRHIRPEPRLELGEFPAVEAQPGRATKLPLAHILYFQDKGSEVEEVLDTLDAEEVARRAMAIAAGICIYTNDKITLEKLEY